MGGACEFPRRVGRRGFGLALQKRLPAALAVKAASDQKGMSTSY